MKYWFDPCSVESILVDHKKEKSMQGSGLGSHGNVYNKYYLNGYFRPSNCIRFLLWHLPSNSHYMVCSFFLSKSISTKRWRCSKSKFNSTLVVSYNFIYFIYKVLDMIYTIDNSNLLTIKNILLYSRPCPPPSSYLFSFPSNPEASMVSPITKS